MPLDYPTNQRLVVLGQTQSGKSQYNKTVLVPDIERYIIWDIKYEYSGGKVVHTIPELKSAVTTKGCLKIIYQPILGTNRIIEFRKVCKFIILYIRGFTFIVDEVQMVAPNNKIPEEFKEIITTGAALGIGCIALSQRPQLFDKTIMTQAEHVLVFFLSSKDLEYVEHYFDKGISWVKTAPKYSYVYYHAGVVETNPPLNL